MIIIAFLLCISLIVAIFFLAAYVWGAKTGQFDDDYSPAHRIFYDEQTKNEQ